MYNRYVGSTGKIYRVREPWDHPKTPPHTRPAQPSDTAAAKETAKPPFMKKGGLENILRSILPNGLGGIDTSDIMLLMILFLLWRESGDEEFLIILIVLGIGIFKDH